LLKAEAEITINENDPVIFEKLIKNYERYSIKIEETGNESNLPRKLRNAKKKHTKCGKHPNG